MIGVILCGGAGERLWPVSSEKFPKFLFRIKDNRSLLQDTFQRLRPAVPVEKIIFLAKRGYEKHIIKELGSSPYGVKKSSIIGEPAARNTAAAIAVACRHVTRKFGDEVMAVFPADHIIEGKKSFQYKLTAASSLAEKGYIVTFGVKPTYPATGYGYIKIDKSIRPSCKTAAAYRVSRFLEKPTHAKAEQFIKQGRFFWNSGIFIFRPSVIMSEIKRHMPALYRKVLSWDGVKASSLNRIYGGIKAVSIDKGIMEKTRKAVVLPFYNVWRDLGDWESIVKELTHNEKGNLIDADCIDVGSRGIAVISDRMFIGTIGLDNVIIVQKDDSLLVMKKGTGQRLKELLDMKKGGYDRLSEKNRLLKK